MHWIELTDDNLATASISEPCCPVADILSLNQDIIPNVRFPCQLLNDYTIRSLYNGGHYCLPFRITRV